MNQDELKKAVAIAAVDYIQSLNLDRPIIGVGTGSTANYFIDELAKIKGQLEGTIASSEATAARLRAHHIPVFDLNSVSNFDIYVDGADEIDPQFHLIKGGGGALTREKIVAAVAKTFVCIADESKSVSVLGRFPLPVEVIPMAQSYVARELVKLGGRPVLRDKFTTDNGNIILDVYDLQITTPCTLEQQINQIVGVVTNGLFAQRSADLVLLGTPTGVQVQTLR